MLYTYFPGMVLLIVTKNLDKYRMSVFVHIPRVQLRLFTKQPTRRQVTLRATYHRASGHAYQMHDVADEALARLLRFTGLVYSLPCCCFHAS